MRQQREPGEPSLIGDPAAAGEPQRGQREQHRNREQSDHRAKRPVGDEQVGPVVVWPESLFVLLLDVAHALQRHAVELAFGQERQHVGHLDHAGECCRSCCACRRSGSRSPDRFGCRTTIPPTPSSSAAAEHQLALVVTGEEQPDGGESTQPNIPGWSPGETWCGHRLGGAAWRTRVLRERTSHHALTAATNVPAVSRAPATVCENAACAVLLVSSATMLVNSARWVAGL